MKKFFGIAAVLVLFLAPGIQNALACGIHGTMGGNDINNWTVTQLSGADQFEIRFKNFNTLAYSSGEMCSCALQIASTWNINSAQLVSSVDGTPLATFPTFTFDSVISPQLQTFLDTQSLPPTGFQWLALKNTIAISDPGGDDADLVFTGTFPGYTKAQLEQELLGKQIVTGKIQQNAATQEFEYEQGHYQILDIILQLVGGDFSSIDTTLLLIAGLQSTAWMIPVVASIAGISLVLVRKKN